MKFTDSSRAFQNRAQARVFRVASHRALHPKWKCHQKMRRQRVKVFLGSPSSAGSRPRLGRRKRKNSCPGISDEGKQIAEHHPNIAKQTRNIRIDMHMRTAEKVNAMSPVYACANLLQPLTIGGS